MPTLDDVAREAGVNKVTVSVVLNGRTANTRVSEATRRRIFEAAERLQYQPHAIARSLRRGRTDTLGFYTSMNYVNAFNPFVGAIINGLHSGCRAVGKDLLSTITVGYTDVISRNKEDVSHLLPEREHSEDEIFRGLMNGKTDGLIVVGMPNDAPLFQRLQAAGLPLVAVATPIPNVPTVLCDGPASSRLILDHLEAKGHRALWLRTEYRGHAMDGDRRAASLVDGAERRGMTVVRTMPRDAGGGLSEEEAGLLRSSRPPTAAVCFNDEYASRLLSHCRKSGIRVPDDLAVVGFDAAWTALDLAYTLTTIDPHWEDIARTATALLVDRIAGKEIPLATVMPVDFILGETT